MSSKPRNVIYLIGLAIGVVLICTAGGLALAFPRWGWLVLLTTFVAFVLAVRFMPDPTRRTAAPPAPQWRILDEEYEDNPKDEHFVPVATALTDPLQRTAYWRDAIELTPEAARRIAAAMLPQTMAGNPAVLTAAQHELAAEHARDKRLADGLGDPQ